MMPNQNHKLAVIILLASTFVMTSQDAITKILTQNFNPFEILFWRFLFLFIATIFFAKRGVKKRAIQIKSHKPWLQLLRCTIYFVESMIFIIVVKTMSIGDIHAFMAATPLVITAFSPWLLNEKVGIYRWSAVVIGFLGVLIIVQPGVIPIDTNTILILTCVILYSLFQIYTRKLGIVDSPETSMLWFAGFVTIVSFMVMVWNFRIPEIQYWGYFLGLSFLGGFSHFLNLQAYRYAPAPLLQPFMYSMFVFAVMWSYLIFNSLPALTSFIGAAIVIATGLFTIYREQYVKRNSQKI